MDNFFISKSNGDKELFLPNKLRESLKKSGAINQYINLIMEELTSQIYDGISSKEIYKKAFSLLKKMNRTYASKYSLKKALFDLGPTGFPFERLVSALLKQKGYKTKVGELLFGECVTHEIDVLAEKDQVIYAVECKFHSKPQVKNNVKIPLYINSRFIDIQKQWNKNPKNTSHLKQGWLVTNTKFTKDAINYAKCVGLKLLSWDYPKNNGIGKNIDEFGLYPITALTTLTKSEKKQIIENDIILITELRQSAFVLNKIRISPIRIERILAEAQHLLTK